MWNRFIHQLLRVPYALHVRTNRRVKKPRATIVLIHGIANSGAVWDDIIAHLPDDVRIITIDLLGFGNSPRPAWATYDARLQARSVIATLLGLRIRSPVIVVGHSLGSLVAVEMAARYPRLVSSLVLCSPPFYKESGTLSKLPSATSVLKRMYRQIHTKPDQFVKILSVAKKYGIISKNFTLEDEDMYPFMGALEASILNQSAFDDIARLTLPIHIIHGRFDALMVPKYLKRLTTTHDNITIQNIAAAHQISRPFIAPVTKAVITSLNTPIVRYNKVNE